MLLLEQNLIPTTLLILCIQVISKHIDNIFIFDVQLIVVKNIDLSTTILKSVHFDSSMGIEVHFCTDFPFFFIKAVEITDLNS